MTQVKPSRPLAGSSATVAPSIHAATCQLQRGMLNQDQIKAGHPLRMRSFKVAIARMR